MKTSSSFPCLVLAGILSWSANAPCSDGIQPVSISGQSNLAGSGSSFLPALSADGRWVTFVSEANNLATNDDRAPWLDVFVQDQMTETITLVSVNTNGVGGGKAISTSPVISSNGQFVAFASAASNLTLNDTNEATDIFIRDLTARQTTLVSADLGGRSPANSTPAANLPLSEHPLISADGRWVVFASRATNLVPQIDANDGVDLFVRDLTTSTTHLISIATNGNRSGNGPSWNASISSDGRMVAFISTATDLAPGATNAQKEIYARDLRTEQTWWASSNLSSHLPADSGSYQCIHPVLSGNGQVLAFKAIGRQSGEVLLWRQDLAAGTNKLLTRLASSNTPPAISADGRWLAYESGTNVYAWDALNQSELLLNINQDFTGPGNAPAYAPVLSSDGARAVFLSAATDLFPGATNGRPQIYSRHLVLQITDLITVNTNGLASPADYSLTPVSLNSNGQQLVFGGAAADLVDQDANLAEDVFLRDLTFGATTLISKRHLLLPPATGAALTGTQDYSVSANGSVVAFTSYDSTLAPQDTNDWPDAFVQNLATRAIVPISARTNGVFVTTNASPRHLRISANGQAAVFLWHNYARYPSFENPGDVYWSDLSGNPPMKLNIPLDGEFNLWCLPPAINPDGRLVAFSCRGYVYDLIEGGDGGGYETYNVYLRDIVYNTTKLVSKDYYYGDGLFSVGATNSMFSPDGQWLLFHSSSSDLTLDSIGNTASLFASDLATLSNRLVSFGPNGEANWGYAGGATFSGNSRYVGFSSKKREVTVHDLVTQTSTLVHSNGISPSLNFDGSLVAFQSPALLFGPTNIFLKDLASGEISLVSRAPTGNVGNGDSTQPLLSGDGRYVVFQSRASDLVPNDFNSASDIFVQDRWAGQLMLVSMNKEGNGSGHGPSTTPILAANGRTVVFQSFANDLIEGDYNDKRDVFVLNLGGEDTDGDGLDDDWEWVYFETLARDGSADYDHDGMSDSAEFRAGTEPTNEGSALRVLTVTSPGSASTTILWSAAAGRIYQVQFKDNVEDADWTDLHEAVTASGGTGATVDTAASSQTKRYYRVLLVP